MIVPSKWLILVDIHYIMIYSTTLLFCTSTDTLILTLSLVGAVGCARQVVDADSNAWSAKQTFDSREKSGARHAGRPRATGRATPARGGEGKHYDLVGGLDYSLFFHILGIIIPIDFHIFQRGSNHQPVTLGGFQSYLGYPKIPQ